MNKCWRSLAGVATLASFAVFYSTLALAQGAINPGELLTGTISPAGDSDTWTFSASTGDSIVVRVGEISTLSGNFQPHIRLFDPSNPIPIATSSGAVAAEVAVTAAATGTYSVIVDDAANTATGTYRITLAKTGSAITVSGGDQGGPMTNGAMHTGTIDVGDLDVWTVSASAGDAIVVRMGEIVGGSALTPFLRIYAPGGGLLGQSFSSGAAEVAITAATGGNYMVVAADGTNGFGGSGDYRLTLAQTGTAVVVSAGDEGGPLTNGAVHTGTIDIGDLDVWTLTANAGDGIVVRMGETVGGSGLTPYLRIYGPGGTLLDNGFSVAVAEVAINAPSSGTYIVVAGDGTSGFAGSGTYRLTLAQTGVAVTVSGGDEGGPMTNGVMHTGTIDVGDLDLWTISANAGDAIVVRMGEVVSGSGLTPWLRIFSPTGAQLATSFSVAAAEVAVTAASAGTYLVVAADATSGLGGSGTYRLTLGKTGSPVIVSGGDEGGPLLNGAIQTGTIDVGDLDVYTLTANAGDTIILRMSESVSGSGLTPWLRIFGPGGGAALDTSFSAAVAEVSITAASSGTYLVVAADATSGLGGSGGYQLMLAQSGTAVTVPPGDEGGPLINGAMQTGTIGVGDLDLWTVTANAGDAIVIRMGETVAGALTPWLRIFSPTGALLGTSFSVAVAEIAITAPTSGTYLVVAADATSGLGGSGSYRITLAKTGSPVTVSPGDEGGPLTNGAMHTGTIDVGDLDVWTLSAAAGQSIVVRMGEIVGGSGLTPYVRVYNPSGTLAGTAFSVAAAEVAITAAASGTYLVVVGDATSGLGGTGSYRLTLAQTGVPVTVSNGDEGGPLTNGPHTGVIDIGDLDVWIVNAVAGDHLVITMTENVAASALTPWLRIYSPAGTLLQTSFNASQATLDLTTATSGTFLVVAADATSGLGSTGGYTLNGSGASTGGGPTLDVDASITATKYDAPTDGLLVLRYLFGNTGATLTSAATGGTATRTDPAAVKMYLDSIRDALDIDANGTADALTDGILIIRYLFGLRGDALINGAVDESGQRLTAPDIENYIQSLTP